MRRYSLGGQVRTRRAGRLDGTLQQVVEGIRRERGASNGGKRECPVVALNHLEPTMEDSRRLRHRGTVLSFLPLPCSWNKAVEPNDTWPRVAPVISEERAPVLYIASSKA